MLEHTRAFFLKHMSLLMAILIVLNMAIILLATVGIGWKEISTASSRIVTFLTSGTTHIPNSLTDTRRTSSGTGTVRTVAGTISSPNLTMVCGEEGFGSAVAMVRTAVVGISSEGIESVLPGPGAASSPRFDDPAKDLLDTGRIGSGVVVDPRGYILTCCHVIAGASGINVTPFGFEEVCYPAQVVAKDEALNLAILRINVPFDLPAATLGDSGQMEVADAVLAIGNPFGLEQTVTHGIVSDDRRSLLINGVVYTGMMQTDAAINRGSSGGPLINLDGEVIGINMAIYSPTGVYNGVSFAMPINSGKQLLAKTIQ